MISHALRRNLRTIVWLLVAALIAGSAATVGWANHIGLPASWRAAIERELAKQELHVDLGSLRYLPFRGIVASEIRVFSDAEKQREISRFRRALLGLDKTQLARGRFRLSKVELSDAALSLPVDPDDPASDVLEVEIERGTLLTTAGRLIELRDFRGRIGGVRVEAEARVLRRRWTGGPATERERESGRRAFVADLIRELERWDFPADDPPLLRVVAEGELAERESFTATFDLRASEMSLDGLPLRDVSAEGGLAGGLVTVHQLSAGDGAGTLSGSADYDLARREGRFDLRSGLDLARLVETRGLVPERMELTVEGAQQIEARGSFRLDGDGQPEIRLQGRAEIAALGLRGLRLDRAEASFAWNGSGLYLTDVLATHPQGRATGSALIEWPRVRLRLDSSLPGHAYRPLFAGQPLGRILADLEESAGSSSVEVRLDGGFDATDRFSWAYQGSGAVRGVRFRSVPLESAECSFSLRHGDLDFHDGRVTFDYSGYPLRARFQGPPRGSAEVGRIRFDGADKLVFIESLAGDLWAAPVLRMFAPPVAEHLEIYRFHRPPRIEASGRIDVTPAGRTDFRVAFRSPHPVEYDLFGQPVNLLAPRGRVELRGREVRVEGLELEAFGGPMKARFVQQPGRLEGEVSWSRLAVLPLATTYGFDSRGEGSLTGRVDFRVRNGELRTLEGEGLLLLENAELLSVPIFGPLSPLVASVLGRRRAGFEEAKDAFCTFSIHQGLMRTNDFRTTTSSLVFTGDGELDIASRTIDFTMRMNARGFLGIITLPLRPLYGLFQFRGRGPLAEPEWENVRFTSPPEEQNALLLDPPRALAVPER